MKQEAPKEVGARQAGIVRKVPLGIVALLAILAGLLVTLTSSANAAPPLPAPITDYANYPANIVPSQIPDGCNAQGSAIVTGVAYTVNGVTSGTLSSFTLHTGDTISMSWSGFAEGCENAGISLAAKSTQHPIFVPEDDQKLIVFDYCGPEGASCTNPQGGFGPLSITVPTREDACNFQIDSVIGRPLAKVGPNGSFYSEDSRSANGKPSGANMLISANNGGEGKCIIPPEASAELSCTLIDGAPGARVTVTNPDDDDTAVVDILKNGVVVFNDVSIPPLGTVTRDVPFDNMETATVSVEDTIGGAQQQLNATAEGDPIAQTEIFTQEFTANCLNPAVTVTKVCASGGLEVHLSNTDAIETATFVVTVNGTSTNHDVAGGGTEDFVIPVGENTTAHVVITQGGTTFVADDFTMDCFVPTVGIENVCSTDTSGATFTFANAGESPVDLTVTKNGVVIDTVTVAPGTTVTKTYPMNEDETATYRVTGPAFDTGDQTLTHDCVHVEAAVVQAQELARTGPGDTKPLMMISGWFLMIGGLFLAVANKTLLRPVTVRSNESRGR